MPKKPAAPALNPDCHFCGERLPPDRDRVPGPEPGSVQHSDPGLCIHSLRTRLGWLEDRIRAIEDGPDPFTVPIGG